MTNKTTFLGSMPVRQLRARRRRLALSMPDVEGLISGSVVEQGRRCGKEGCRCASGELHGPYTYVVLPRAAGRTRTVYVPAAAADAVRAGAVIDNRPALPPVQRRDCPLSPELHRTEHTCGV
jgi:hypothetical protein